MKRRARGRGSVKNNTPVPIAKVRDFKEKSTNETEPQLARPPAAREPSRAKPMKQNKTEEC
jgi:hypothetical protein